jgi:beta-galactosidase
MTNIINKIILSLIFSVVSVCLFAQHKTGFNDDWKFYLGDDSLARLSIYNDAEWRKLNLPHDWSIEGPFSDTHATSFNQGALPAGIGWYRKKFKLPPSAKDKVITIIFDGIYRNSEVWINGRYLGKRPNGYVGFQYEMTPHLKFGNEENVIAVRVDNSLQPSSRWYTGSGIYRNVWLQITNKIFIDRNTVFIRTRDFRPKEARVDIHLRVINQTGVMSKYQLRFKFFDSGGKLVTASEMSPKQFGITDLGSHSYTTQVAMPRLWSPKTPALYKVLIQMIQNSKVVDEVEIIFGFRYFDFDAAEGFFLNGKPFKILGVCMHHDLGALGAAVNKQAIARQLKILKAMGCNAIRTAHNPPAPELLELCDKMGFLVMDEAYDMWKKKKNKFDYSADFDQWHKKDLQDIVRRDRNHPSVFMWSIGNEIREQFDTSGTRIAKELVQAVKDLDPTRPVTSALTENLPEKNYIYQSKALDVLGFNYKHGDYAKLPSRFPGQKFLATETASALATRGHYEMPSDSFRIWPPNAKSTTHGNPDKTVSAYDNTFAYWGGTHEETWKAVKKNDFISGIFVWSGFDFLGEPVPYQWPSRSSYYGIVDLAGFPKDVYYLYQSEWTNKPVLHIFPHWNWPPGKQVDVWAYYSQADEVELFLNGRSLGKKQKSGDSMHIMWRVPFEPGVLKAVSKKEGKIVLIREIQTAGTPYAIQIKADRNIIAADGKDLSFVTVCVVDKAGNLVPDANNLIKFTLEGPGSIAGLDNGDPVSHQPFKGKSYPVFHGMGLAIIQSTRNGGSIVLTATSHGLIQSSINVKAM